MFTEKKITLWNNVSELLDEASSILNTHYAEPYDLNESNQNWSVSLDVPGVDKKDVKIKTEGDFLIIEATRSLGAKTKSITRRVILPQEINLDTAQATLENGVLTVAFLKNQDSKSRFIPIK